MTGKASQVAATWPVLEEWDSVLSVGRTPMHEQTVPVSSNEHLVRLDRSLRKLTGSWRINARWAQVHPQLCREHADESNGNNS